MKKLLVLSLGLALALVSCKDNSQGSYPSNYETAQVVVTPSNVNLGDGLDLKSLGELVKSSPNATEIEKRLNKTGSINNLDLNGDGNVDYITVTEYGSGNNRGFSFVVEVANGEKQEVANVSLEKIAGNVNMNVAGNQQIYGAPVVYRSNFSVSDLILMNYLFSYHRPYYSPYHYGYYPRYYAPYRSVGIGSYRSRTYTTTKSTSYTRNTSYSPKVKSPNSSFASKTVSSRAKSLSSPTRSQKSFTPTNSTSSRPKTSGFGNSSYRSSSSSSSYKPSSSSSSYRSSSSSSRSSFGSSSRSSSRSSSHSSGRRSDFRFKSDIMPMTSQLDKISKLQGVNYNWKIKQYPKEQFTAELQEGFIAQDIEKVYPNLVHTRVDGYKTVDYEMLIPSLVEAIKELKAQNTKQDSIIKTLTHVPSI